MHPALVFILILLVNFASAYWLAATPEFLAWLGHFIDIYVFPGAIALAVSIAAFWLYLKLCYIVNRLRAPC